MDKRIQDTRLNHWQRMSRAGPALTRHVLAKATSERPDISLPIDIGGDEKSTRSKVEDGKALVEI